VQQEVVPGQQPEQHRQAAEAGVRGERQQHQRDQLDGVEEDVVPDRARCELGEDRRAWLRQHVPAADQHAEPEQHQAEQHAERHLGVLRAPRPRQPELRHRVGDRLDAGQRRAAGRE